MTVQEVRTAEPDTKIREADLTASLSKSHVTKDYMPFMTASYFS